MGAWQQVERNQLVLVTHTPVNHDQSRETVMITGLHNQDGQNEDLLGLVHYQAITNNPSRGDTVIGDSTAPARLILHKSGQF